MLEGQPEAEIYRGRAQALSRISVELQRRINDLTPLSHQTENAKPNDLLQALTDQKRAVLVALEELRQQLAEKQGHGTLEEARRILLEQKDYDDALAELNELLERTSRERTTPERSSPERSSPEVEFSALAEGALSSHESEAQQEKQEVLLEEPVARHR